MNFLFLYLLYLEPFLWNHHEKGNILDEFLRNFEFGNDVIKTYDFCNKQRVFT